MEEENYTISRIRVSNLMLNLQNYRFKPQESQRGAINQMLSNQGDKLYNLAEDIVENSLNPSEYLIVTPIDDGNAGKKLYKVLEGNRRITALKLLAIPENIEGAEFSKLKAKFQKLHKRYAKNPISSVACVVFPNESDANIWIEKKHSFNQNGTGTERWDSKMKQRFDDATKGKKSATLQILDLLRNSDEVSAGDFVLLDTVKSSNLERLISDPYVRDQIGIEKRGNLLISKRNKSEVVKSLLHVIRDISRPDFKVSDIYTKEDRKPYIDNLLSQLGLPKTMLDKNWTVDPKSSDELGGKADGDNSKKKAADGTGKTRNRSSLIPRDVELPFPSSYARVYDIFRELRLISVRQYPNTVAVMFRVFLELSVNAYMETFKMLREGEMTANDSKHDLAGHTQQVVNHMVGKGYINRELSKGIKNELKAEASPLSIESLNAYVHSARLFPQSTSLITGWDNVQPFFEILWTKVSEQQAKETE